MPRFRVYIEEISTRLFSRDVIADERMEAEAVARACLEDATWTEWDHGSSDASVEDRPELTGVIGADNVETRLGDPTPLEVMKGVVRQLTVNLDMPATFEHPGFIAIPIRPHVVGHVGTAAGYWSGEVMDDQGEFLDGLDLEEEFDIACIAVSDIAQSIKAVVDAWKEANPA